MKTLSCEEFQQFIDPYIDAEFDHAERALFDAHLSTCAGCRKQFEHRTWFQRGIRPALKRPVITPTLLHTRIQTRLRQERRSIDFKRSVRKFASASSAVASVGLILLFVSPLVGFSTTVVDEALDHHQLEMPLELPSPRTGEVDHWLEEKLPFKVHSPTFHDGRVQLLGGRLSRVRWSDQRVSRPAAHLVYLVDGKKMSVLVFQENDDVRSDEVSWHEQADHRIAIFRRGRLRYAITSRLPAADFQRVVSKPW
ncbi:MAG: anti-sigma factor family protein [Bradymonadia bacterium]